MKSLLHYGTATLHSKAVGGNSEMKKILTLIILLQTYLGVCQESRSPVKFELSITDLYVVDLNILEKIGHGFCDCSVGQKSKRNKCVLYKIKINDLVFQADSTVFSNKDILRISNLLVPRNWEENISVGENRLMILSNTSSKEYLQINTIISPGSNRDFDFISKMQLSSLIECKKNILHLGKNNYRQQWRASTAALGQHTGPSCAC
ncbi:MAG: hypothetical protein ACFB15_06390 [Cyclobacteriaceae bacterium]